VADDPPFLDRHEVVVAASPQAVWEALPAVLPGAAAGVYARLVGADPARSAGVVPDEGAAVPGFRVEASEPPRRLRLAGRHRFSRYVLEFTLEPAPGGTRLAATSHAAFPGLLGTAYRALVVGSGGHGLVVPAMLRAVGRRATA
jgi:hypothetical protein